MKGLGKAYDEWRTREPDYPPPFLDDEPCYICEQPGGYEIGQLPVATHKRLVSAPDDGVICPDCLADRCDRCF